MSKAPEVVAVAEVLYVHTPWSVRLIREEVADAIVKVCKENGVQCWRRTEKTRVRKLRLDAEPDEKKWHIVHFEEEWVLAYVTAARQAENYTTRTERILGSLFACDHAALEAIWRLSGHKGIVQEIHRVLGLCKPYE